MSPETNKESLESLSIADLVTLCDIYHIKLKKTNDVQEILVYNQVIDIVLKQLNNKLTNIFIY